MRDGQGYAKGGGAALLDGAKGASTVVASATATDSIFSPAMLRRTSLLLLVLQNYSQFMLMRESRKDPEDGAKRAPFSAAAAVVVQEVIKTVVSLAIIAKAHGFALESTLQHLHEHLVVRWRDLVKLSVPGILYTAQVRRGAAVRSGPLPTRRTCRTTPRETALTRSRTRSRPRTRPLACVQTSTP